MFIKQAPKKSPLCLAMMSFLVANGAYAGGFSLYSESSAVEVGNFAAGAAAEVVDASTGWYNPAGLVLLKQDGAVISGVGVIPSLRMNGVSTYQTEGVSSAYVQSFQNLEGGEKALVPALHYAHRLGERAAFGLSIVSPFGLSTNWGGDSPIRYAGTLTQLTTITVSPELAARLTDTFSFGAGLDLQWARVRFNAVQGSPAAAPLLGFSPTGLDSSSVNQGNSIGVGYHLGILGAFNDNHTRVGLNYQSNVSHRFYGYSTLSGPLASDLLPPNSAAVFQFDGLSSNNIEFPNIITLSAYQDLSKQWAVMGSAVYTSWSVFKTVTLDNVAAFSLADDAQTTVSSSIVENYRNTWRFAVGANYHVTDIWMLRAGGGYDQTPTVNAFRDVRLPDVNRWALSVGTHYQARPSLGFDLGYTYLFGDGEAVVNKSQPIGTTSTNLVTARAKVNAQLAGLQVVWTAVQPGK